VQDQGEEEAGQGVTLVVACLAGKDGAIIDKVGGGQIGGAHPDEDVWKVGRHLLEAGAIVGLVKGIYQVNLEQFLGEVLVQGFPGCVDICLGLPPHTDAQLMGGEVGGGPEGEWCGGTLSFKATEDMANCNGSDPPGLLLPCMEASDTEEGSHRQQHLTLRHGLHQVSEVL
jgi:hypothetical protein